MEKSKIKIGIFYYSGSGSTCYYAKYITKYLENKGNLVQNKRITNDSNEHWENFDLIGIG